MIRATETTPKSVTAAKAAGRRAAYAGIAYSAGREVFTSAESALLLAWSKGHNAARVGMSRKLAAA